MSHDAKRALDFLSKVAPDGPWCVTAVTTSKKSIITKTYFPDHVEGQQYYSDDLTGWLAKNRLRNIYWLVNPPMGVLQSRNARLEEIKEVRFLHVDVDPRAGEPLDHEHARISRLVTDGRPTGIPEPTYVVFSGGGFQAFWQLQKPLPVEGQLKRADEAKRWNMQLEIAFGADSCHNINRLMRLPGTINWPDAKKKKAGRKPIMAELVLDKPHNIYPIEEFSPAPQVQVPGSGFSPDSVRIDREGDLRRLESVDELDEWNVPTSTRVAIVQGEDPDRPKERDNSRSAWLFDVVCSLARCEVPDETIYAIITDPGFGISDSVLDKGRNSKRYALRQIERAKEYAEEPWLCKLNERHAVISNLGGKCVVVEEVYDHAMKRSKLAKQTFTDFRNRYLNHTIEVPGAKGMLRKPLGDWWLRQPKRRQFEGLVFAPEEDIPGYYNLWRGYGCQSQPGNCELFLAHVLDNLCNRNAELYTYVIRWLARCVQNPAEPGQVAVVLRGGRGTGKSLFAKIFGKLFGRHFLHISNAKHLTSNFNAHLRDCVVLFADEAYFAGDRQHASQLKALITEESIAVEAKGIDTEMAPNNIHLIMASNDAHVVPAGGDERRFLVLDVSRSHQRDTFYFGELVKQMENGGYEALLHTLRTLDLEGFSVWDVPETQALRDQKRYSMQPLEEWWYQKLLEGRILPQHDHWENRVTSQDIYADYMREMDLIKINRRSNQTKIAMFLRNVVPGFKNVQRRASVTVFDSDVGGEIITSKRTRCYEFGTLAECRQYWEELFGETQWIDETIEEEPF